MAKKQTTGLPPDLTLTQICYLLAVTKPRISQLVDDGTIERVGRDRYSIASVPRFVRTQRERGAGPAAWNAARIALTREKARVARLERLRLEGKLVDLETVVQMINAHLQIARINLLGLGPRHAPEMVAHAAQGAAQIAAYVTDLHRGVLQRMSEMTGEQFIEQMRRASLGHDEALPASDEDDGNDQGDDSEAV